MKHEAMTKRIINDNLPSTKVAPLLVIVGETASGKSTLALKVAERLGGELICADSWTVYKGFDIGTAKPSASDRARVPHHLLDVADPVEGFSAVVFQRLALRAITDIASRGKLPILVGGTGLYVDSVIYNYSFLPPTDPAERARLNGLSLEALHARAAGLGLKSHAIDWQNKRRVIRLIENNGQLPTKQPLRSNTLVYGLTVERNELTHSITERVDTMLRIGLEGEVDDLRRRYGWGVEPMKGIGYGEWEGYFGGTQSLVETRQKIIKDTLDLAKRQRTWFKRNKSIHWLDNRSNLDDIVDLITTHLSN